MASDNMIIPIHTMRLNVPSNDDFSYSSSSVFRRSSASEAVNRSSAFSRHDGSTSGRQPAMRAHSARGDWTVSISSTTFIIGCSKGSPTMFSSCQHPQRTPEGTPPVLASPAALLDDPFEHPIGCDGTHFLISSFLQHLDNRAIGRRKLIVGQIFYRHPSPFFTSQYLRRAT